MVLKAEFWVLGIIDFLPTMEYEDLLVWTTPFLPHTHFPSFHPQNKYILKAVFSVCISITKIIFIYKPAM